MCFSKRFSALSTGQYNFGDKQIFPLLRIRAERSVPGGGETPSRYIHITRNITIPYFVSLFVFNICTLRDSSSRLNHSRGTRIPRTQHLVLLIYARARNMLLSRDARTAENPGSSAYYNLYAPAAERVTEHTAAPTRCYPRRCCLLLRDVRIMIITVHRRILHRELLPSFERGGGLLRRPEEAN